MFFVYHRNQHVTVPVPRARISQHPPHTYLTLHTYAYRRESLVDTIQHRYTISTGYYTPGVSYNL